MEKKIQPFLDEEGRVKQLPGKNQVRVAVYRYLGEKFEEGRNYTEKEVNGILTEWNTIGDYFILRRGLVDHGVLGRTADGADYWRIAVEKKPEC